MDVTEETKKDIAGAKGVIEAKVIIVVKIVKKEEETENILLTPCGKKYTNN